MCKYCCESNNTTFGIDGDGDGFSASGYIYTKTAELATLIYYHCSDIDVELRCKIHYCPMCGRKLGD